MSARTWSFGDHASLIAGAEAGVGVIRVVGELDLAVAEGVQEAVNHVLGIDDEHDVEVDLGQCTFIDSSGISALLLARRACADAGRALFLRSIAPAIIDVLEVTGITGLMCRPDGVR